MAPRATVGRPPLGVVLSGALVVAACASRAIVEGLPPQAYYRTGFPITDISADLERVLPAVPRIQVQGTYDVYLFLEVDAPTDEELDRGGEVLSRATRVETSTTGRAATAVVIASSGGRSTLLTTDHGITLPDTTIEYFASSATSRGAPRLERVAIKRRQVNTVVGASFVEPFQVLARSPDRDLALIGLDVPAGTPADAFAPLRVPMGEPRRLSWGSLIYVVGHPAGYQMITRAIVSQPGRGSNDSFLTDGLSNEGMSGAAILAVRGDTEELELVGVARAAATRRELRLVPDIGSIRPTEPGRPYDGPLFLREVEQIRYGITFSIPVGEVRDFLADNRSRLAAAGYPTSER